MAWLASLWDVLAAAGGSVALSFIVALALGLAALTIFFLGSSIVVLERFARAARSPLRIMVFGVAWAAVMAAVLLDSVEPGASVQPWAEWLSGFGKLTLSVMLSMLIVVPATALLADIGWLHSFVLIPNFAQRLLQLLHLSGCQ